MYKIFGYSILSHSFTHSPSVHSTFLFRFFFTKCNSIVFTIWNVSLFADRNIYKFIDTYILIYMRDLKKCVMLCQHKRSNIWNYAFLFSGANVTNTSIKKLYLKNFNSFDFNRINKSFSFEHPLSMQLTNHKLHFFFVYWM